MFVLELGEDMMDVGLFCWKWMEIKETGGWGGFRVAELCRSVYFVTAGMKAPAETYCSSPMKRQILDGSMKRFELFQLTGALRKLRALFNLW